jgi:hypothetical protein
MSPIGGWLCEVGHSALGEPAIRTMAYDDTAHAREDAARVCPLPEHGITRRARTADGHDERNLIHRGVFYAVCNC